MTIRSVIHASGITVLLLAVASLRADNWPAWRGPNADGHCAERDLPLKWSAEENVLWKVDLPDKGNSTPIIWGDRIFLTQATDKGHKRSLMCFNRKDGSLAWEKAVQYKDDEPTHADNPYCSASPVTDGERVVVSHGSAGVYCYDLKGEELWHRDLGKCHHIWGNAASPIIYENLVILNFGPGERTFLIAMDKKSGDEVWKVDMPGGKLGDKGQAEWQGSWSTPVIAKIKGQDQLIMTWPGEVKAYDPKKGTELWSCKGLEKDKGPDKLVYASPLVTDDAIVAMAGYGGAWIGVKPGGSGDVTETHRLWRNPSAQQRIGTGVVVGEHIYMVDEPGTAQCIELKTGKTLWNQKLGSTVWGSLVLSEDKLYVTSIEGDTFVFAAKPEKFEQLAKNPLGEKTLSSIAASDRRLYIRTYKHLWCIGK
jgi:outer membrane protein assembly factor BamB